MHKISDDNYAVITSSVSRLINLAFLIAFKTSNHLFGQQKFQAFEIILIFNYHNKMIKNIFRGITTLVRLQKLPIHRYQNIVQLNYRPNVSFSQNKTLSVSTIPQQVKEVKSQTAKIGEQQVEVVKTKDSISIMDRVQGVKAENGQLYILSFTCTKCQTRSIRSFTKHAYHKGVVLVRCGGCDNIHLVADNIGWFQDQPVNVETMHKGNIQRVHDPVAITRFLKKAFEEDQKEVLKQPVAEQNKKQ